MLSYINKLLKVFRDIWNFDEVQALNLDLAANGGCIQPKVHKAIL